MEEILYIVNTYDDWYSLRIKSSHYTLSSGHGLQSVLNSLAKIVEKYKTEEALMQAIKRTDDKGVILSPFTYENHKLEYEEQGDKYAELIERTVAEALHEERKVLKKLPKRHLRRINK